MAQVEIKFELGQKIYVQSYGEIRVGIVASSTTVCQSKGIFITYVTQGASDELGTPTAGKATYKEDDVYKTKQEAVEAWLRKQNMTVGVKHGIL